MMVLKAGFPHEDRKKQLKVTERKFEGDTSFICKVCDKILELKLSVNLHQVFY